MKEEFDYEVKPFVPTKRKKKASKVVGIILAIILATGIVAGIVTYRMLNTPEYIVAQSFMDFFDHTVGEKSYVLENFDLKSFDKKRGDDNILISGSAKIKELGDFGLYGLENYVSGVSISADCLADWDNLAFNGQFSVGYSLFGISLLQASFKDSTLAIGSNKFFDEVFGIELVNMFSHLSVPKHRLVEKKGQNTYEVTALKDYVPEGDELSMVLTLDKEKRITKVVVSLKGDKDFEKCEFVMDLTGKTHPTDEMQLVGSIVYQGQELEIKLNRTVDRSGEVKTETSKVELNLFGLLVSAELETSFNTSNNEMKCKFSGTDGVDVLNINAKGALDIDETIELDFSSFEIYYSDKFIINLKTRFSLKPSDSEVKSIVDDASRIIDVLDIKNEIAESVFGQIMKQIDSYMDLFNSI